MNVRYFFYHFENTKTGAKIRFDIRPFLKQFAALKSSSLKNKIKHQDEFLYLTHQFLDVFMLIQTKQHEIIRKVNTQNLTVAEVNSMLVKGEHLGFAAYLVMESDHFGICSTLLAPRFEALTIMMEKLLELLGIADWQFVPTAVMNQIPPSKIRTLNHVGRTTVRVKADMGFGESLKSFLGEDVEAFDYIDELEITLKPKKNRSIGPVAQRMVDSADATEITKMTMRAKETATSAMMDVYLAQSGIVSDYVNKASAKEITAVMQDKMSRNKLLQSLVKENRDGATAQSGDIDVIASFHSADNWWLYIDDV